MGQALARYENMIVNKKKCCLWCWYSLPSSVNDGDKMVILTDM